MLQSLPGAIPLLICTLLLGNYASAADATTKTAGTSSTASLDNSAEVTTQSVNSSFLSPAEVDPQAKRSSFVYAKTNFELYGHLDLSVDAIDKGISGRTIAAGDPSNPVPTSSYTAQGHLGWMSDISSNLSYFGIRGSHELDQGISAVFQIETQADISATPGTSDNNASADNSVKSAIGSRNSFVGVSGKSWGSVKIGKTDTPYKASTGKLDPFSATVGDYNAIMGNTGGDNRAEFDLRLSHSIWYDSPDFNGVKFSVLYSPGQNRGVDSTNIAAGEPSCTGGNNPIGGGLKCADGSFDDAWSTSVSYATKELFVVLAGELHRAVNRSGDEQASGGGAPNGSVDTADEQAYKLGVQYDFPTTRINAIYEVMERKSPALSDYNERSRSGWWLAVTQKISSQDNVNLGWGHAGVSPGDPGDPGVVGRDGKTSSGPKVNQADLAAISYQHVFSDKNTSVYAVYARTMNKEDAHYDLGASGHGITTDCHDGSQSAGGFSGGGGICFTGGTLQALSVGLTHDF